MVYIICLKRGNNWEGNALKKQEGEHTQIIILSLPMDAWKNVSSLPVNHTTKSESAWSCNPKQSRLVLSLHITCHHLSLYIASFSSMGLTDSSRMQASHFAHHCVWSTQPGAWQSFTHPSICSSTEFKYLLSSYHRPDTVLGTRDQCQEKKENKASLSIWWWRGENDKKEVNK